MRAMILHETATQLELAEVQSPVPHANQVLIKVEACAICRTDLHVIDGELPPKKRPLILGHQIVGRVTAVGLDVRCLALGDRVGVPWLGWVCGECKYCRRGQENLCGHAKFTGYHLDGGFAEEAVAFGDFVVPVSESYTAAEAAPLLCGGLIGYRSYRFCQHPERLGLYGFGAAAHLIAQVAHDEGCKVYAFTRPGDGEAQRFALELGADWAGGSDELAPEPLDAAIIFAPVGALVPRALRAVDKGGVVVCGGIHMSDIPAFPYSALWEERVIRSVANLTREDAKLFLALASKVPVRARVHTFALEQTNEALEALRSGAITGSGVIVMGD